MIKIFNENDTVFNTNGLIAINPINCKEIKKKSLNGWYLDLQIDIRYQDYIKKDMLVVIKSKSKLNPQAFRLEDPKYTNNIIEVVANHVMFDSKRYMLYDVRPTNKSALAALEYINERTDKKSPFTYESSVAGLYTAYFNLKNLCESWQIIEERWEGIFDADNWNITFSANLGKNVGEMLVYKKNITSFRKYEDWSNVVTRIYPVGDNGLRLPEKYIDSDIQYKIPYTRKIEINSNLEGEFSEEQLIENLRGQALKYLNENKYPKVSYEVSSNINESYDVNDKIIVKHPLANIQTEVQEYTFDHIKKKTINLVFGNYTRDVKSRFDAIKNDIIEVIKKANNNSVLIKNQTDLINNLNKNGVLYIDENELLILDKAPREDAKYVWRFGIGGLGFSKNGYEGPFETAWTLDGNFNANFIQSGKINTSLIEGYDQLVMKVSNTQTQITDLKTLRDTLEGTNELIIEDALEANAIEYKVEGKSEQKNYEGYQLFDITKSLYYNSSYNYFGINMKIDEDGTIKWSGKATEANTYYNATWFYRETDTSKLKLIPAGSTIYYKNCNPGSSTVDYNTCLMFFFQNNNGEIKRLLGDVRPHWTAKSAVTEEDLYFVGAGLWIDSSKSFNDNINLDGLQTKVLLTVGQKDNWEPYVGGNPSPNPDYPQEIKSIEGIHNYFKIADSQTKNGITFTKNEDGSFDIIGTSTARTVFSTEYPASELESGQYTLFSNINMPTGVYAVIEQYQDNTWLNVIRTLNSGYHGGTFNANVTGNKIVCYIAIDNNTTIDLHNAHIQLEKGNKIHGYTSFGKYILVNNNGENNEENIVLISLKKQNLFDKDNANILNGMYINNTNKKLEGLSTTKSLYIPINPNMCYTILKRLSARFIVMTTKEVPILGVAGTNIVSNNKAEKLNITSSDEDNYLVIFYYKSDVDTLIEQEIIDSIKIYEGTNSSDYWSLESVGEVRDELEVVNNRIILHKKNDKITLNGSETINRVDGAYSTFRFSVKTNSDNILKIAGVSDINPIMSNKFKAGNRNSTYNQIESICYGSGTTQYGDFNIYCDETKNMTVAEFKTWLTNNPVEVLYQLAEPYDVDLGQVAIPLQQGYNKLTLVEDLETNTEVTYLRDNILNEEFARQLDLDITNGELNNTKNDINNLNTDVNNSYQDLLGKINSLPNSDLITQINQKVEESLTSTEWAVNRVEEIVVNGVTQVKTGNGMTFNDDGLNFDREGAQVGSSVDEAGMKIVDKTGASNSILQYTGYVNDEIASQVPTLAKSKGSVVNYAESYFFGQHIKGKYGQLEEIEDDELGKGWGFFIGGDE